MSVQRIFWLTLIVGFLSGIGWMYLLNGILGHALMKEALIAFLIFQGIGTLILAIIHKNLMDIWHITIRFPGKDSVLKG